MQITINRKQFVQMNGGGILVSVDGGTKLSGRSEKAVVGKLLKMYAEEVRILRSQGRDEAADYSEACAETCRQWLKSNR